jgi:hypothetical protein
MKKAKERLSSFWKSLKHSLPVTLVMGFLWLLLGWLRSYGIHSVFLSPLNYLTGALAGLDGGSFVGGTIGKAIILIVLNNFVRSLLTNRGSLWERAKAGFASVRTSLLRKIPQYLNIKQLFTKEYWRITINGIGFGLALIGYSLFTGNGSFENSFVCLLLFAQFGGALVKKRGLIITAANRLLSALGTATIDRDMVNRLVGGNALGYFAATLWAAHFNTVGIAGFLGAAIAAAGLIGFVLHNLRKGKEAAL